MAYLLHRKGEAEGVSRSIPVYESRPRQWGDRGVSFQYKRRFVVKTQSTHTVRWFFILALLGVLALASCNRSATQGILPEDMTVEETTVEEPSDAETPDTTMEVLLEDDLASTGEGAEDATEGTEQLAAEGETTADDCTDDGERKTEQHRYPETVNHPGNDIACLIVGAQPVGAVGP